MLEVPAPANGIRGQQLYANDQSAMGAAKGVYNQMNGHDRWISNGGCTLYTGLSADEYYNYFSNSLYDPFTTNALTAENNMGIEDHLWQAAYKSIYHANAVLEGIAASKGVTLPVKQMIRGEMLVTRALHYFYLVNLFGDVPWVTTTEYEVNQQMPRTPASQIYQQLVTELSAAKELLAAFPADVNVRPNQYAASALLARVYLYLGNWEHAEREAGAVIQASIYRLPADLDQVFRSDSEETIWQLLPGTGTSSNTAEYFLLPADSLSIPEFPITDHLLQAFEPGDHRKIQWLGINQTSGRLLYYPYKYKSRSSQFSNAYYTMLRLGEQYLIRAEARARQNKWEQAAADVNSIRHRAGLPGTMANSQATMLNAIEQERRIELFAEWGHRWMDLKRTHAADPILKVTKSPGWQATDTLYPIPQNQLRLNPLLIQNPGY